MNDTLQNQVTKLSEDNNSFQGHVKNLQETTSSLSAQIAVLAIQAKAAAANAHQLQASRESELFEDSSLSLSAPSQVLKTR